MSNQKAAQVLIRKLTGQANVLTIPRVFVEFMGSLDGALLLSQCLYWSDRTRNPEGWFYKSYVEWEEETCLSKYEVSKNVKKMQEMGFLETKLKKANGAPTVHYRILFDEFEKWIGEFLANRMSKNFTMESEESEQSLTETTTETTTENPHSGFSNFDYLNHITHQRQVTPTAVEPSDFDKFFGKYRDEVLQTYSSEFEINPNSGKKSELVDLSMKDGFDMDVFKAYLHEYNINGGNPYKITSLIKGYWVYDRTGDIEAALNGHGSSTERELDPDDPDTYFIDPLSGKKVPW